MVIKNLNLKLSTVYFGLDSESISTSSNHNNIRLQSRVWPPNLLKDLLIRTYHTKSLSSLHTPLELNPLFIKGFAQTFVRQYSKNALQQMYQNKSTSLVVWGTNLQLTVKERFSRKELAMLVLTPYIKGVVVGLILSDGWLIVNNTSINARLGFSQSVAHSVYFRFVFFYLAHYCF